MDNKITILHVLFVSNNKSSGVRNVVPKHVEYQNKYANVALLNCNNSEVEESEGKFNVYKLSELKDGKISNLPTPYNKPDIVVFHAIYYPQYINLYKQLKIAGIPYIVVPHGSLTKEAQKQKRYKKIPANLLLFNGYVNNAIAIQFLIEGEMKKSRKVKKYIIAGNGIELSKEKKEFKEGNDEFKFVYIGRYDMYTKGLDLLLAAIKMIKNDAIKNNMKFILYGTDYRGGEEQVKELITNYELEDIVKINGPVWEKEKEKALCDADVFLHVSRTEGQPIGLMEAIDCGVPCIATFETNYGEIIEKNGLGWMAETTAEGIAKKIIEK